MKALTLLFFLSSPALGHQILFNDQDFLNLANGDPIAGHELFTFCAAAGKDFKSCKNLLSAEGKNGILAARFCVQSFLAPQEKRIQFQVKESNFEALEKGFTFGKIWHEDYQDSTDGRHLHGYSEQILGLAVNGYTSRLIHYKISRNHARAYISLKYHFTDPRLSKEEMEALKKDAERARSFPYIEYTADLVCLDVEKKCISGSGSIPKDKVMKAFSPTPSKSPTIAEECLKDELIMMKTGLRGVIRD